MGYPVLIDEFQFLIGTIKTGVIKWNYPDLSGFQFLIGTIKTQRVDRLPDVGEGVSIPYRYYKNRLFGRS